MDISCVSPVDVEPLLLTVAARVVGDVAFGNFEGDLGSGGVDVFTLDAVVRPDLTDRTEAADDTAVCGATGLSLLAGPGVGRVIRGLGGPLIWRVGLADEGVGLVFSLVRRNTRLPFSAAVGLRALALPGIGAVAGPETDRAERVLATEAVEAELLRRSRRRPGASSLVVVLGPLSGLSVSSVVAFALIVDGREEAMDNLDEEAADDRKLPASESDMARDVVRGSPPLGALAAKRLRTNGEMADGPIRSSSETSISVHQLGSFGML